MLRRDFKKKTGVRALVVIGLMMATICSGCAERPSLVAGKFSRAQRLAREYEEAPPGLTTALYLEETWVGECLETPGDVIFDAELTFASAETVVLDGGEIGSERVKLDATLLPRAEGKSAPHAPLRFGVRMEAKEFGAPVALLKAVCEEDAGCLPPSQAPRIKKGGLMLACFFTLLRDNETVQNIHARLEGKTTRKF